MFSRHKLLAWSSDPQFYWPPSGFCFLGLMSFRCISTVRHADLAGSYSPRTSNRQNPFGPFRPTGPEMKKVPRWGVRGVRARYSFNRNRNASDARCKSDPGPRSGNGRRCNDEIIEDGWRSGSPLGEMLSGGSSDNEDSIFGCSWGLIGLSFSCPEIIYLPLSNSSASRGWEPGSRSLASCRLIRSVYASLIARATCTGFITVCRRSPTSGSKVFVTQDTPSSAISRLDGGHVSQMIRRHWVKERHTPNVDILEAREAGIDGPARIRSKKGGFPILVPCYLKHP